MKKIYWFFMILLLVHQSSHAQWALAGTPFSGIVRGIFFNNADTGYAVGPAGVLSKTTDGGITWIPQASGGVTDLRGVHFVNDTLGYITGASGVVLKTINGGGTWVLMNAGISPFTLRAVDVISADTVIVAGSAGVIWKSTDGGVTWNSVSLGILSDFIQLDMIDANVGYAVACDAAFLNGFVFKTTDGGNTWSQVYMNPNIGLLGLAVANANTVYAGGGAQTIIKTTDGGSAWDTVNIGIDGSIRSGFALSESVVYMVDDFGNIFSTTDGGTTWNNTWFSNGGFYSIYFPGLIGYTGEGNGNVYKYTCVPGESIPYYADKDSDGFGDPLDTVMNASCIPPDGYLITSADCNDADETVHPNAEEVCNGIDDNCNGVTDEDCVESCAIPTGLTTSKITASSAKLKWNALTDAQRYKLRYKSTGSGTWTKITNIKSTSKAVSGLLSNTSYTWQVKSVCTANPNVSSGWSLNETFTTGSDRMGDESLQQISFSIYPNPAEDHATIKFTLAQSSHVSIKVYDVSGREMVTLLNDDLQQGEHSLQLNTQFTKGVYLVKMIFDSGIGNQKLIVQ